jgi:hypothetical protein
MGLEQSTILSLFPYSVYNWFQVTCIFLHSAQFFSVKKIIFSVVIPSLVPKKNKHPNAIIKNIIL